MTRDPLEAAIRDLADALAGPSDEAALQALFENRSEIWRSLGYEAAHPHIRLPLDDGESLIPDFFAVRPNGLAEIVDLKTTARRLVRNPGPRAQFFADVEKDLAQLREYQRY